MTQPPNGNLLGLPAHIDRDSSARLRTAIAETWFLTNGTPVGTLPEDLAASRRWFDPIAQGQRLRRELAALKPLPQQLFDPGPPLTFVISPEKRLITPEGRCALDLLEHIGTANREAITDSDLLPYERRLGALYGKWSRHRIESVVNLLAGSAKPLQVPAAGVVIALLVNRCDSEDRALTRFASGAKREVVDQAFFAAVQAFADLLAPSRRGNRNDPRLVTGWMLYEARRRLGEGLVVVDARQGMDGKVWVAPEFEDQVIDRIGRALTQGHRLRVTPDGFLVAFDALVVALRQELPKLAAFGLVHERPGDTRRLRQALGDSVARYAAEPQ